MIPKKDDKTKVDKLTIDYKKIASIPIGRRNRLASTGILDSFLTMLTPGQRASLFPSYYRQLTDNTTYMASLENPKNVNSLPSFNFNNTLPSDKSTINSVTNSSGPDNWSPEFHTKAALLTQRLMKDLGLSKQQASAIAGNFAHESGQFKTLQEIQPGQGRGGYGWAQWTGPRRRAFEEWAKTNNMDISSDEANYQFFLHEISTDEYEKERFDTWKNTNFSSVGDATIAFENTYERSAIKHYDSRIGYANEIFGNYDNWLPPEQTATPIYDGPKGQETVIPQTAKAIPNQNSTPASEISIDQYVKEQIERTSKYDLAGTVQKQGVDAAIGRLHPEYLRRASAVEKELAKAGFTDAHIQSGFRPKEYGVNTHPGWSSDMSLHGFGLASDWGNIPKYGTPEYKTFVTIMESNGFYNPYPNSTKEWNHWQIIPEKTIGDDKKISALRDAWSASGYSDNNIKKQLDMALNDKFDLGAGDLLNPQTTNVQPNPTQTADTIINNQIISAGEGVSYPDKIVTPEQSKKQADLAENKSANINSQKSVADNSMVNVQPTQGNPTNLTPAIPSNPSVVQNISNSNITQNTNYSATPNTNPSAIAENTKSYDTIQSNPLNNAQDLTPPPIPIAGSSEGIPDSPTSPPKAVIATPQPGNSPTMKQQSSNPKMPLGTVRNVGSEINLAPTVVGASSSQISAMERAKGGWVRGLQDI